jgi:hypothetical protein
VPLGEFYRFVLDSLGLAGRRLHFMGRLPGLAVGIPEEELAYSLSLPRFDSSATCAVLGDRWCPEFAEYRDAFWKGYQAHAGHRGA